MNSHSTAAARDTQQDARSAQQGRRDENQDQRDIDSAVGINSALERVVALERWQVAQNGSLRRMEEKLDRLFALLLGACGSTVLALAGVVITLLRSK
jgi:hypothetical protein